MMMRFWKPAALAAICLVGAIAPCQSGVSKMTLAFSQTEVALVLKAISLRTHANIVYVGQDKLPVTINVEVGNIEDAIKSATSAANLVYRNVNGTYIVSKPDSMRQALAPFVAAVRLDLKAVPGADAVKTIGDALPYSTVTLSGDKLQIAGVDADLKLGATLLDEMIARQELTQPISTVTVLKNASATQVATLVAALYPTVRITPVGDVRGALGLYGPKAVLEAVQTTIDKVDVLPTSKTDGQVYKVYHIRYSSAPLLRDFLKAAAPDVECIVAPESYSPLPPNFNPLSGASIGGSPFSGTGGTPTSTGTYGGSTGAAAGPTVSGSNLPGQSVYKEGDRAKSIVIRGAATQVEATLKLLEQIDVKPRQVLVEVHVVDTSPSSMENLGFTWNWDSFKGVEGGKNVDLTTFGNASRPAGFGKFGRVPWSITAMLNAIATKKDSKILADPKVQVLDNDDANIFIGDTIRARIAQSSGLGGQTVSIVEFPIGIILLIRPRVNADGQITMRVHPVVSTISSIDSNNIPQTSSREAETTVMVKDGETMVIGGLIQDEYSKTVQSVPILSQLPIVGELFRNRTTSRNHSEVLVFITPHLLPDTDAVSK